MFSRWGQHHTGVVLISVLLILAVATVLVAAMLKDQHIATHSIVGQITRAQAREYALGGEEIARQMLYEDWEKNPLTDHLGEIWASEALEYEFEQGALVIRINDRQSCFNVNSLAVAGNQRALNLARFQRLLSQLGVNTAFADRLVDWIDGDQTPGNQGAEDYHYLGLEAAYRTGDTLMADISELKLLLEMTPEEYELLASFVCVLPVASTGININTANAQLIMSLDNGLSAAQAEQAVTGRGNEGYNDLGEFETQLGSPPGLQLAGLSLNSSYFEVSVEAHYQNKVVWLTSLIDRNLADGTMRVIYRDFSKKSLFH